MNCVSVPLESNQGLAVVSLPEPRRFVPCGGEHPPTIRTKDRARNPAGVAVESNQGLAAVSLPEPRRFVSCGGEHPPTIRAKDRTIDRAAMALVNGPQRSNRW